MDRRACLPLRLRPPPSLPSTSSARPLTPSSLQGAHDRRRQLSQLEGASSSSTSFRTVHPGWFRPVRLSGVRVDRKVQGRPSTSKDVNQPDRSGRAELSEGAGSSSEAFSPRSSDTRTRTATPPPPPSEPSTSNSDIFDFSFLSDPGSSTNAGELQPQPRMCDKWLKASHGANDAVRQRHRLEASRRSTRSSRGFKTRSLDLEAMGMKAVTKDASGFVYSAGVEPPPPARFLTYAPEGWRSSDGQAGGVVSIDQDFFTPTPRASLATRRSQSALSPYASRHARNPVPPPVPDIHDFHRDPFDPASPSTPIPSAFQLEQGPTRRSKTRPTTAVDNEEASLDRLPHNYNVVDDLTTDAPPPPSMLFRSVSRPLAFNPSATRTIGRPLKAKTLSSTRDSKVKEESAVAPALTAASVLALGPETAWAQYLQMTPAGYPPDLLAALFDSQAALDLGSVTRRDRLVNIALRATAFVSDDDPPLTLAQFTTAFVLGLDVGEEEDVAFEDENTVRVAKAAKQETAAILLREIWRAITDLKERGAQPDVLSWDESVGLFWRWVGLVAWTGPASADEPSPFPYARPNAQTDRIDDLALFLDKIASTTETGLSDFAQSVARGWVNQDLVADLEQARQQVIDIRVERDQILVQDKTLDMREAREKLWTFLRSAYYGRGASDDKAVEGWVETLLVAQTNPPESAITTFEEAASLRSRWTTTLLIVRNIARSERAIPASCLWYLCDGLKRLNGTAEHRLSLDHLRSLASTLLESSPDLSCISSRQHYDLLLEFIRLEDLPFAERFYQTFRLRERQFAFSQEVTHSLLRLAIQFDGPAAKDSDALKRRVRFVSSVYDDCVAWGSPALKGELLAEFLAVVAPDPGLGGLATRVLSDSIFAHGHDVLTDDIAFAIAQAARERVVSALTSAGDRTKAVSTSDCTVSVASSFSVLPLLRGCYKHLSRQPPVSVFNDLLAFAAEHPTAENLEASVAEFTTMVNHGPAPDTETFNILIRMHLGVRRGPSSLTEMFARVEPCEPHVNMVRAITLFKTMVVRQKLQPNRNTFSHFVHGLVEVGQPLAAFECFRHAVNLGLFPSRESTSELVRALVADGHQGEVETVAAALESLLPHRKEHGRPSSISSPATLDEVGMKTLSDTVLSTVLPTRRPPSSESTNASRPPSFWSQTWSRGQKEMRAKAEPAMEKA